MAAALSEAVTVHRANFPVHFVVALRFAKDGIRVCLRSLFCVRATRKQRPGGNESHKQTDDHFAISILETTSQAIHRISDL